MYPLQDTLEGVDGYYLDPSTGLGTIADRVWMEHMRRGLPQAPRGFARLLQKAETEVSIQFLHVCDSVGPECNCFPPVAFLMRDEIQDMLRQHQLQEVFDTWEEWRKCPCLGTGTIPFKRVRGRTALADSISCPRHGE